MADELMTTNQSTDIYEPLVYSSITIADAESRKVVANATNNAESLAEHEGETINVIGVMCKPGVRRARTKDDVDHQCTDTLLICADGSAYFTKSEGIRRAVENFLALGLFEDGEPVAMQVVTKTLPGGNTMKTLVLV